MQAHCDGKVSPLILKDLTRGLLQSARRTFLCIAVECARPLIVSLGAMQVKRDRLGYPIRPLLHLNPRHVDNDPIGGSYETNPTHRHPYSIGS